MRFTISTLAALMLAGCSESSADLAAADVDASPTAEATPAPNYTEHRKGVYYYVTDVSENAKANGQASGNVVGYRYLGVNAENDYTLELVDHPGVKAYCAKPCGIIRFSNGMKMGFAPDSVIGTAFTDAMNGQLKVYKRK